MLVDDSIPEVLRLGCIWGRAGPGARASRGTQGFPALPGDPADPAWNVQGDPEEGDVHGHNKTSHMHSTLAQNNTGG